MKIHNIMISMLALSVLAAGCKSSEAEPAAPQEPAAGNVYNFRIKGDLPRLTASDGTKVTFNDAGQLEWTTSETCGIILGNDRSTHSDATSRGMAAISSMGEGIFQGAVDFGTFSINDVHGAVYPYNAKTHYYITGSGEPVIWVDMGGPELNSSTRQQVQQTEGVLDGSSLVLISYFGAADMEEEEGVYFVDGKQFDYMNGLIRFNIFGTAYGMTPTEKITSIALSLSTTADENGLKANYRPSGNHFYYPLRENPFNTTYNNSATTVEVKLANPATVAGRDQASGVKLFMGVIPHTYNITGNSYFEIRTDRSTYRMPLVNISFQVSRGQVTLIGIDLTAAFPSPNSVGQFSWISETAWTPVS